MRPKLFFALVLLIAIVVIAVIGFWNSNTSLASQPIAGLVRQTEIRIAPEVNGRLATIEVETGQHVTKGILLARLDNPDLDAAVGEAKAAEASARAERDHIISGTRAEEVEIAGQAVQTAQANLLLAQQQNARAKALAAQSFASRAQLDESNASLAKSIADLQLKQAQWKQAKSGPTGEERALAEAKLALAHASVVDAQSRLDKTFLMAPTDGTVALRIAEPGEILLPGHSVMTIKPDEGTWFAFTLREDDLRGLTVGSKIALVGEAGEKVAAKVTELRPLGEFATWRAARAVGDHDLNSFRLRLDPVATDTALTEGMTVLLPGSRQR
jgi:HlyD family secretion protein